MPKTDKELAVEFASTYVSTWFARSEVIAPLSGQMIHDLYQGIL